MKVYNRDTSITYAKDLKVLKRFMKNKQSHCIANNYNNSLWAISIHYGNNWYYQKNKKSYIEVVSRRVMSLYKKPNPISRHISRITLSDKGEYNYILIVNKDILLKPVDPLYSGYTYDIIKPKQFTKFYY